MGNIVGSAQILRTSNQIAFYSQEDSPLSRTDFGLFFRPHFSPGIQFFSVIVGVIVSTK